MRKVKCLLMSLVLLLVVAASALAGETQGPNVYDPGEMNTPPGETQGPPAPGQTQGPGFADYLWTIGAVVAGSF